MNELPAQCQRPPFGWFCSREPGHEGPCAAWPHEPVEKEEPARGGEEPAVPTAEEREEADRLTRAVIGRSSFRSAVDEVAKSLASVRKWAYIDSLKADRPKAGRESEQPFAPSCPHCGVGGPMFLEADRAIVEAAERYVVSYNRDTATKAHESFGELEEAVRAKRAATSPTPSRDPKPA